MQLEQGIQARDFLPVLFLVRFRRPDVLAGFFQFQPAQFQLLLHRFKLLAERLEGVGACLQLVFLLFQPREFTLLQLMVNVGECRNCENALDSLELRFELLELLPCFCRLLRRLFLALVGLFIRGRQRTNLVFN